MLTHKPSFINILRGQLRQSSCHGSHILSPRLELDCSILLARPCQPFDTLTAFGREAAQNGQRTERIQRWLSRWNCDTAICTPAPIVRWSRSASGKLPSTSPGVRNASFFPSKVPPDQKVEFCSSIGQIFPLILRSTAVLKKIARPRIAVPVTAGLARYAPSTPYGAGPVQAANVGEPTMRPVPFTR